MNSSVPHVLSAEALDAVIDSTIKNITREELTALVRRYESGITIRRLAKLSGVCAYEKLLEWFHKLGVPLRPNGHAQRRFTDDEEAAFLSYVQRGCTYIELARMNGTTRETISKACARARKRKAACPKPSPSRSA